MNKIKGFTLVELLAVIVILGIIALVTIPKIQDTVNESRQAAYDLAIIKIKEKADDYADDIGLAKQVTSSLNVDVYLSTLITNNYLVDEDLIDPRGSNKRIDPVTSYVRFYLVDGQLKKAINFTSVTD